MSQPRRKATREAAAGAASTRVMATCVVLAGFGLAAFLAGTTVAAQETDPPILRFGDAREVVVAAEPPVRSWRLEIDRSGPVWVALRTLDVIPELTLARWGRPDVPVSCDWERLGFNEYVCIRDAPGVFHLQVRLQSASRRRGRFSLCVGTAAPPRVYGDDRAVWEAAYFRRVLAQPGVTSMPPFEVTALERLVDALRLLGHDEAQLAPLDRAIGIYDRNGRHLDAARLLEARARVEARLGRFRPAVATCERAVLLRLVEGDDYQAVLTLGWAYCLGATHPGRLADRLRLRRALAVARGAEAAGHVLEDLAELLQEEGLRAEAVEALEAAGVAHDAAADLTSAVRAAETLFVIQLARGAVEAGAVRVEMVAAECFEHGRLRGGVSLLRAAAVKALRAGHLELAWRLVRKALGALEGEDAPRAEAMTRRVEAEVLRKQVRHAEAATACARAAALFARAGEIREEAAERVQLGFIQRKLRRHDAALAAFRRAAELAGRAGDQEQLTRAWNGQGCVHHDAGDHAAARIAYDRAFALATAQDLDAELRRDVVRNRILIHQDRGDASAAAKVARDGVAYLEKLDDAIGVALTWIELGHALRYLGRLDQALEAFRRACDVYRTLGDRNGEGRTLNEMGNVRAQARRHAAALADYSAAHALAQQAGDRELEVWTIFNLGYTHARLGEHDRAAGWFVRAVDHYRPRAGGTLRFAGFLSYVARVLVDAGRTAEGIVFAREAAEILAREGTPARHARAWLALGDMCRRSGRRSEAHAAWSAALRAAQRAGQPDLVTAAVARLVAGIVAR